MARPSTIPARGGIGLKAEHYRHIIETKPNIGFFEIHAENYMGEGGPPHRYLEAIRERSALLHEQITDLRAEMIDRRSLMIAIVALIFLPLTFVTGLFGMNVDGIPYAHHPGSFWAVTGFSVFVGLEIGRAHV